MLSLFTLVLKQLVSKKVCLWKPSQNCQRFKRIWNGTQPHTHTCTPQKNFPTLTRALTSLSTAPQVRNLTQDGGFGQWAPWQNCNQDDGDGSVSRCSCRSRSCDGPPAQCGGRECEGPTVQVANCSRCGWESTLKLFRTRNTMKMQSRYSPPKLYPQERRLDPLVLLEPVQQQLRNRLRGAAALVQQPGAASRRPGLRGPESRGEVGLGLFSIAVTRHCKPRGAAPQRVCFFRLTGCATRRSPARCPCCGRRGDRGHSVAPSAAAASTREPGAVRTGAAAPDAPW